MKQLVLAAALCLPAALAAAAPCTMGDAVEVPALSPAKAAFLAGDFDEFAAVTTALVAGGADAFGDTIGQLKGLFPDGFESCQTIAQRRDAGGMVQEVTTFNIAGVPGPMSIYLVATPVRGEMQVSYVYFNTTLNDVLDRLR